MDSLTNQGHSTTKRANHGIGTGNPYLKTRLEEMRLATWQVRDMPYCCGTLEFPPDTKELVLYFGNSHESHRVDFARPGSQDMDDKMMMKLMELGTPVEYELEHGELILDESHRQLELGDFSTTFDFAASGIMDVVQRELPLYSEYTEYNLFLHAELSGLDVYGPGKRRGVQSNRYSRRGTKNPIGSIVVILPTSHEGGDITLRDKEMPEESDEFWTTHTANSNAGDDPTRRPAMTFLASEHDATNVRLELGDITSGYVVMLTYDLCEERSKRLAHSSKVHCEPLRSVLEDHLADPRFLPNGGVLAFGLSNKYGPIVPYKNMADLLDQLHSKDVAIRDVCTDLRLRIHCVLHTEGPTSGRPNERRRWMHQAPYSVGEGLQYYVTTNVAEWGWPEMIGDDEDEQPGQGFKVHWVEGPYRQTSYRYTFVIAHQGTGERKLVDMTACGCLLVSIGPAGRRETA